VENLQVGLGRTVSWNANNLPTRVSKAPGPGPGVASTSAAVDDFVYGPELQRLKQTATISAGQTPE